jgi:hypothetical protein
MTKRRSVARQLSANLHRPSRLSSSTSRTFELIPISICGTRSSCLFVLFFLHSVGIDTAAFSTVFLQFLGVSAALPPQISTNTYWCHSTHSTSPPSSLLKLFIHHIGLLHVHRAGPIVSSEYSDLRFKSLRLNVLHLKATGAIRTQAQSWLR